MPRHIRDIKLTRGEKALEDAVLKGEYVPVSKDEAEMFQRSVAAALAARRKDAVLNMRVNSNDLKALKEKARKLGVRYQTFISEILHLAAQTRKN